MNLILFMTFRREMVGWRATRVTCEPCSYLVAFFPPVSLESGTADCTRVFMNNAGVEALSDVAVRNEAKEVRSDARL